MNTKLVETVLMHGPKISDPSVIEERDVPVADIAAYRAAGFTEGPNPAKIFATVGAVYSLEDSVAQLADKPVEPKRKRK